MVRDLLTCIAHLQSIVPEALRPPFAQTAQILARDLAYLEGTLSTESYLDQLTDVDRAKSPG